MSVGAYTPAPADATAVLAAVQSRGAREIARGEIRFSCPAHDDEHPSARYKPERGVWRCDVCGAGGGFLDLAKRLGVPLEDHRGRAERRFVKAYDFVDEHGALLFQEVRYEPKDFRVRRADGTPGLEGVRRVLYNLPAVLAAAATGSRVYVVEGPKDAGTLIQLGIVATTNALGAGKWRDEYAESLRGAEVIVVADKDDAGRTHAAAVAHSCSATAKAVKLVELPGDHVKDASDFLSAGGTREELERIADLALGWTLTSHPGRGGNGYTVHAVPAEERPEFPLTDFGNAERLVARHGDDLRYCAVMAEWYAWDGQRWRADDTGEVERRAKETARAIYGEAEATSDPTRRQAVAGHAVRSEAAAKIGAMISLAQSEAKVSLRAADLDVDPWALNAANGTLDLRSGELRPHRRDDLITMITPISYDPAATCPTFLAFLDRVLGGDAALVAFMRRAIGYSLTGLTTEQKLLLLYGTGANGKSTLLEALRALLGDYARHADFTTFLASRGDSVRNDIARLRGARLVTATEMESGRALAEVAVKQVTGGDTITARKLYAEFFEFKPRFKLFLAANHKPAIRGTDHAIWRRICLVPFKVTIPPAEQDPQLGEKLLAELTGILAWAVQGCLEWQVHGLDVPATVLAATENYREEMDVIGDFLEERCALEDGATVTTRELYSAYEEWAKNAGEKPIARNAFGMRLAERGFERTRTSPRAARQRAWRGIRLAEAQMLGVS